MSKKQRDDQAAAESQAEKFKHKARELGADESEESFMDKLKRLAKAKPKSMPKPRDKITKNDC